MANGTAGSVIDYALTMLGQTANSNAAGLPLGGLEGSWAIDPTTQLLLWATEAQNQLCRLCVAIQDYSATFPSAAGAQMIGPYTNLFSPSGRSMNQATDVWIGQPPAIRLSPANFGDLPQWYPADINGNPTGWANLSSAISLSPYTTKPLFTINGLFLPAPLTDLKQPIDGAFDDYRQRAMADYIAWCVATKNLDNSVLAQRAAPCVQDYASIVRQTYTTLVAGDSTVTPFFAPETIDAQVSIMNQKIART